MEDSIAKQSSSILSDQNKKPFTNRVILKTIKQSAKAEINSDLKAPLQLIVAVSLRVFSSIGGQ